MKKAIYLLFIIAILFAACQPKPHEPEGPVAPLKQMPAVKDVAMYQVNPRVFAPEKSLLAVADHIAELANGFSAAAAYVEHVIAGFYIYMTKRPVGKLRMAFVHRTDHQFSPKAVGLFGVFYEFMIFHVFTSSKI